MRTPRKFSLFIVAGLVVWVSLGCEKKRGPAADTAKTPPNAAREQNEEGSLEARCFEGDPEACDELGH